MKPQNQRRIFSLLALGAGAFFSSHAFARPEYAVEHGFVSCRQCHANPMGGGIRNEGGKIYGARDLGLTEWSRKPIAQFDFRSAFNSAKSPAGRRQGVVVMTAVPAVNIPIMKDERGETSTAFVAGFGLGLLDSGLHEAFALTRLGESTDSPQLVVGRFAAPFGLATDEHRTYTRLQTKTTVKDFEAGMAVSGDAGSVFHYDLALTSGIQGDSTGGQAMATNDDPYAVIANARWNPFHTSQFFGLSSMMHRTAQKTEPLTAHALTFGWAMGGLTGGRFEGTLLAELTRSRGWNDTTFNKGGIPYFIPASDTTWTDGVKDSQAQGSLVQLNWNVSRRWVLTYKQEQFTPDITYPGDTFNRYGIGAKVFLRGNMDLTARFEKSTATRPGLNESGASTAVNDFTYLLFHLWI